jgi:hypothetical protein
MRIEPFLPISGGERSKLHSQCLEDTVQFVIACSRQSSVIWKVKSKIARIWREIDKYLPAASNLQVYYFQSMCSAHVNLPMACRQLWLRIYIKKGLTDKHRNIPSTMYSTYRACLDKISGAIVWDLHKGRHFIKCHSHSNDNGHQPR